MLALDLDGIRLGCVVTSQRDGGAASRQDRLRTTLFSFIFNVCWGVQLFGE